MAEPNLVCPVNSPRSYWPPADGADSPTGEGVRVEGQVASRSSEKTEAAAPALSAGTQQLVAQFSQRPAAASNDNAQRTSQRTGADGYAEVGITSSGDSAYAALAALKSRDAKTGVETEVFSVSLQVGGEMEAQAALARTGISGKAGSAGLEVFTLRANGGAHNDDGSIGFNSGAMATAIGAEATLSADAESLTLGASLSLGAAVSLGVRDANDDGTGELCVKVSAGPVTVGTCFEVQP